MDKNFKRSKFQRRPKQNKGRRLNNRRKNNPKNKQKKPNSTIVFRAKKELPQINGLKREEVAKAIADGLKEGKNIEIAGVSLENVRRVENVRVLEKVGKCDEDFVLSNYMVMLWMPSYMHTFYVTLIDYFTFENLKIKSEDKTKLVQNMAQKKTFDNVLIAKQYLDQIKVVQERFYKKLSDIMSQETTVDMIEQFDKILKIRNFATFKDNFQMRYKEVLQTIEKKDPLPYCDFDNNNVGYIVHSKWKKFTNVFAFYSPYDLIALAVARIKGVMVLVANIGIQDRYTEQIHEMNDFLEQFFEAKMIEDLVCLNSKMDQVPNLIF